MPDIAAYMNAASDFDDPPFPLDGLMARCGQLLVLIRSGVQLPAQMVVIADSNDNSTPRAGQAGTSSETNMMLHGYRDVAGQPNFDVKRGDLFKIGTAQYKILQVKDTIRGRRVAEAEGLQ